MLTVVQYQAATCCSVHATIYVEREGQKGIHHRQGRRDDQAGSASRRVAILERIFRHAASSLELDVKVKAGLARGRGLRFGVLATLRGRVAGGACAAWRAPENLSHAASIVLDKTKLKETDLILTLLARAGSARFRAVAKGRAQSRWSRLAARCELFCTVDLLLATGAVARCGFPGRAYGSAARRRARLRDDLRRKRDCRGRACVLIRGRRGPVYLCHHAAGACPGGRRARRGAYGPARGGICL